MDDRTGNTGPHADKSGGPRLIGLTGQYCAGKNYVAGLLEARGIPVLDVDKLGHQALEEEKEAILSRFGADILTPDGNINRRLLGSRVFADPQALKDLEAIVHPRANQLTETWIAGRTEPVLAINAALLHRSAVFSRLSCIIIVQAGLLTRLIRAKQRDRLPFRTLLQRFNSQNQFTTQYFHGNADTYVVK
ncbi:MAG: dephospho-CoA kinase, partial [Treponema sp.]|nr:dephospho-CoA kinase [Treponema sp.]